MSDDDALPQRSDAGGNAYPQQPAFWRERLAPYCRPTRLRSAGNLLTSVVPYFALSVLAFLAGTLSPWYALAFCPVSAVFLVRTFTVFHDCTHGSFWPTRRGNVWLGAFTGLVVLTPFARWRHDHAVHHASAGDLDRRGVGDLPTLTVAEYLALSRGARLRYRAFRHPLVMFGIGPVVAMIIGPRLIARDAPARMRRSVLGTDLVLGLIAAGLVWWVGSVDLLLVWGPPAFLAGAIGIWLFYVQHQFEDAYWERSDEWGYADAALRGSSYLALPRILRFATGNIGYHHVHHLSVRIPNYHLRRTHEEIAELRSVPALTLLDGIRATRLKLWDEDRGRLVGFAEARRHASGVPRRIIATGTPSVSSR